MSVRIYQDIVDQMKKVIDKEFGIVDNNGKIVVCNNKKKIGVEIESLSYLLRGSVGYIYHEGFTYKAFGGRTGREMFIYMEKQDEETKKYLELLVINFTNLKKFYDEKYDKDSFIKNIILDNIMFGDVTIKAQDLRISYEKRRVAILIRLISGNDLNAMDILKGMFPSKSKEFVILINESNLVLVKEVEDDTKSKDLISLGKSIEDMLNAEGLVKCHIGIGSIVNNLGELARSYKEAQSAIEVGKIFDNERYIISYENLGIGRIIYQLPTTLCELFLKEIFKKGSLEELDQETFQTIQKFFDNNLNVSETSRQLYIHRNTLVYRLDKIEKITGLDLRIFEHAIVFKVALMVQRYLDSIKEKKYYK